MSDLISRILDWWANDKMPAWGIRLGEVMERISNTDPVLLCFYWVAALAFIVCACCIPVAREGSKKK